MCFNKKGDGGIYGKYCNYHRRIEERKQRKQRNPVEAKIGSLGANLLEDDAARLQRIGETQLKQVRAGHVFQRWVVPGFENIL